MRIALMILTILATVMFYAGIDKLESNPDSKKIYRVSGAILSLIGIMTLVILVAYTYKNNNDYLPWNVVLMIPCTIIGYVTYCMYIAVKNGAIHNKAANLYFAFLLSDRSNRSEIEKILKKRYASFYTPWLIQRSNEWSYEEFLKVAIAAYNRYLSYGPLDKKEERALRDFIHRVSIENHIPPEMKILEMALLDAKSMYKDYRACTEEERIKIRNILNLLNEGLRDE